MDNRRDSMYDFAFLMRLRRTAARRPTLDDLYFLMVQQ
jgi:hypothetical protein